MVDRAKRESRGRLTMPAPDSFGGIFGTSLVASMMLLGAVNFSIAHASATTSTIPFTEALNFSFNPAATGIGGGDSCCDYLNVIKSGPATPAVSTYDKSGTWGSVTGFASADLATGQLKMRAGASVGDGSTAPSIQTNAIFGDGFRATTPGLQPFNWTSTSHSRFTLDLSGTLTSSHPLDSTFNADAFVILSILAKGTLDPNQPLVNGPTAQRYFFWNIGNPSTTIYYTDQNHVSQILTPTAQYSDIPPTITADFNPGGDFDWVLLLGASGQVSNPGDSFDFDLSHTLTLSYSGPNGSVTNSVSNQFTNFGPTLPDSVVPEPNSLLIVLGGLAGMAALRRRA